VNIEHQGALVEGGIAMESWITFADNERGFQVPKGTWMMTLHISDQNVWNEVINGKVRGFSAEGMFAHIPTKFSEEIKNEDDAKNDDAGIYLNTESNMTDKKNFIETLRNWLSGQEATELVAEVTAEVASVKTELEEVVAEVVPEVVAEAEVAEVAMADVPPVAPADPYEARFSAIEKALAEILAKLDSKQNSDVAMSAIEELKSEVKDLKAEPAGEVIVPKKTVTEKPSHKGLAKLLG
jgi:polyhydroxyalkanoate synthesis regulator phasin